MPDQIQGYGAEELAPKTTRAKCGWCNRPSWFERRAATWAGTYSGYSVDYPRLNGIYQCPGCTNASLIVWHADFRITPPPLSVESIWPTARAQEMKDVEDELQIDRLEAWNAFLHGLNRAAVLMARSALQRTARHLLAEAGVEQKRRPLEAELDLLVKEGVIIQQLRDNAEEVRLWGNDVAHPEEMEEITEEDAEESLTFLDDFLNTTVAVPNRQRRSKEAREAREGETTSDSASGS